MALLLRLGNRAVAENEQTAAMALLLEPAGAISQHPLLGGAETRLCSLLDKLGRGWSRRLGGGAKAIPAKSRANWLQGSPAAAAWSGRAG